MCRNWHIWYILLLIYFSIDICLINQLTFLVDIKETKYFSIDLDTFFTSFSSAVIAYFSVFGMSAWAMGRGRVKEKIGLNLQILRKYDKKFLIKISHFFSCILYFSKYYNKIFPRCPSKSLILYNSKIHVSCYRRLPPCIVIFSKPSMSFFNFLFSQIIQLSYWHEWGYRGRIKLIMPINCNELLFFDLYKTGLKSYNVITIIDMRKSDYKRINTT